MYQPEKLKKNEEFFEILRSYEADFFVVVAYGKIIPQDILDIPKYYCLNIHGSLLPSYRWASPIQESLKNGDEVTWLTIMEMIYEMDAGPTFTQAKINVDIVDKTPDIFAKFVEIGPGLVYEVMKKIMDENIQPIAQDSNLVSHCGKIEREDGHISFTQMTAREIYNRFRAYTPWPGIFCEYQWKKFAIDDCFFTDDHLAVPWQVVQTPDKKVFVWCKTWALQLKMVKPEWKKAMDIASFLNGNKEFLETDFS